MRKITEIIITDSGDQYNSTPSLADLEFRFKDAGLLPVGGRYIPYHYIINIDGSSFGARSLLYPSFILKGHNLNSISICLIGGMNNKLNEITCSVEQYNTLYLIIYCLLQNYDLPPSSIHFVNEAKYRSWFDSLFMDSLCNPLLNPFFKSGFEVF